MPKKKFALEKGGERKLIITHKMNMTDWVISFDGDSVGSVSTKSEIENGAEFQLPDGSVLSLKLKGKFPAPELEVLRNGEPLPGSSTDPFAILKGIFIVALFFGGVSLVVGLIAELGSVKILLKAGANWGAVVSGVVYIILGILILMRSKISLGIFIVLFILDIIASTIMPLLNKMPPMIPYIIIKVFLLFYMFKGFGAINRLKALKTGE